MIRFLALGLSAFLLFAPAANATSVDINTADAGTIDKGMTGVGPKLAKAIVEHRTKNGPFKSVDDLVHVKGLRQDIVDKNRRNLSASQKQAGPTLKPQAQK